MKLDKDQLRAVKRLDGPALVVAGPGIGKTTVIKERILDLVREHKVEPSRILAIAFTNAASEEMKKRLRSEPVLKGSAPEICTLHVLGKNIICNNYEEAGFSQEPVNVWDERDIAQIINTEIDKLKMETKQAGVAIYKFEGRTTEGRTTGRCYIWADDRSRAAGRRAPHGFIKSGTS